MIKSLVLSLAVLLAGCAGTRQDFEPFVPGEGEAVVYVYRPSLMGNFMLSPNLLVNDNTYFKLANGKRRSMRMRAGNYVLELEQSDLYTTSDPLELTVKAGEIRYLRIDTRLEFVPEGMNRRIFNLVEVDASKAQSEIRKTTP